MSPAFAGSDVPGLGALPAGVFGDMAGPPCDDDGALGDVTVSVVPDAGAAALSGVVDAAAPGAGGVLPVVAVLPLVDVVDGFDIELSVFGASALLQAPSTTTAAAMATHRIDRFMVFSGWWGT